MEITKETTVYSKKIIILTKSCCRPCCCCCWKKIKLIIEEIKVPLVSCTLLLGLRHKFQLLLYYNYCDHRIKCFSVLIKLLEQFYNVSWMHTKIFFCKDTKIVLIQYTQFNSFNVFHCSQSIIHSGINYSILLNFTFIDLNSHNIINVNSHKPAWTSDWSGYNNNTNDTQKIKQQLFYH